MPESLGALVYRPITRNQLEEFKKRAKDAGITLPDGDGPETVEVQGLKLSVSYLEVSRELGIEILETPRIFGIPISVKLALGQLVDVIKRATGLRPSETS